MSFKIKIILCRIANTSRIITKTIFFAILLCSNHFLNAQRCGGSYFHVEFYFLNGEGPKEIHYEFISSTPQQIDSLISNSRLDSSVEILLKKNLRNGIFLDSAKIDIEKFSKHQPKPKSLAELFGSQREAQIIFDGAKLLNLKNISVNGIVESGRLIFPTSETYFRPLILKLTYDGRSAYIAANFFGGCYRNIKLIWDKYFGFGMYKATNY